ncbi:RAM signaling network component [Ascosphaera aggregata]|nr:RAM signaling network component [Ascosphaera aggregata]
MMIRRREQPRSPRPRRVDLDDQQPSVNPIYRTYRRVDGSNIPNPATPLNQKLTSVPCTQKQQQRLLTDEETLYLCMRLVEGERVHDSDLLEDVRPKLTINMGRSHISRVPDSLIDIIKAEVARLSLSHNSIDRIPPRISECVHLRYINIRANKFTQFPQEVFSLPYLEILDLSRNRIPEIPGRVKELTSLRVLSIMQNLIQDLPDEISGMTQLQILKLTGNPLRSTLKMILEKNGENNATPTELADREPSLTFEIKKFLKSRRSASSAPHADTGNISEPASELPRIAKRGSRFPVVPSRRGSTSSYDGRQLSTSARPPPIPTRSHYRLASGNNNHHGAGSLTVHHYDHEHNSPGERNRSKSEGRIDSNSSPDKQRRMPFYRKNTVLGTLDELRPYGTNHVRLHSGSDVAVDESGAASPSSLNRLEVFKHQMSRGMPSIIRRKVEAVPSHPVVEGSKSLLYSLYQIFPHLSSLIGLLLEDDHRGGRLEVLLFNAALHLGQLDDTLKRLDTTDWAPGQGTNTALEALRRESETCVVTFMHIGNQLQLHSCRAVTVCDPRFIRSLLLLFYGSLTELRNAHQAFEALIKPSIEQQRQQQQQRQQRHRQQPQQQRQQQQQQQSSVDQTLPQRDTGKQFSARGEEAPTSSPVALSASATSSLRGANQAPPRRVRNDGTIQHTQKSTQARVRTRPPPVPTLASTLTPELNDRSRSSSRSHVIVNTSSPTSLLSTPKSAESFSHTSGQPHSPARVNPVADLDDNEEERSFEKIFVQLTDAYNSALQAVPAVQKLFAHSLGLVEESKASTELPAMWNKLIYRCTQCVQISENLRDRLTHTRIREPSGYLRNQKDFWQLCKAFLQAFIELVTDMREAKNQGLLTSDVVAILRPVQRASREAGRLIEASPWSHMAELNTPASNTANNNVPASGNVRPPQATAPAPAPKQNGSSNLSTHLPSLVSNGAPPHKIASRPPTPLITGHAFPGPRPPIPIAVQTGIHLLDRPLPPDPPTHRPDGPQAYSSSTTVTNLSVMRR